MSEIAILLDEVAFHLFDAEETTSGDLKRLEQQFANLAGLLATEQQPTCHAAVSEISTRLASFAESEGTAPLEVLEMASQTVTALQAVLRGEVAWEAAALPAALVEVANGDTEPARNTVAVDPTEEPAAAFTLSLDPELLEGFIAEAHEHLETADVELLALENDPKNQEGLSAVFRAFHTIKGVAGFMDLTLIAEVAHEAENVLDMAREGKLTLAGVAIDSVFTAVDALKTLIRRLESGDQSQDDSAIRASVDKLIVTLRRVTTETPQPSAEPAAAVEEESTSTSPSAFSSSTSSQAETLRVDRDRLDSLVDMIGELVIAEAMVQQDLVQVVGEEVSVGRNLAQLNKITRNLQEVSLSLRMVPIRATFQKMARMIRDLSKKIGKPIEFHMTGEDTELDKTVVDQIGDPLMHMVRNAVDHGIEADQEVRRAAGKSAEGHVTLKAFHQGGNIYIEIQDDGRGLDPEKIRKKALERGIISTEAQLSDRESLQLIFHPGFSTAEKVTDVSGRGVGMDVVRRNIESLRGNVDLKSVPGEGTCVSMRLPLTLAIIDGMVVSVGAQRYIIPTLSIVELLRPSPGDVATVTGRGEYFTVRDTQLPLLRIANLFNDADAVSKPSDAIIVVVEDDRQKAGLLVDAVHGQQQAVIKSLGHRLEGQPGLAGGAVMPDGKVGLILDVHGLLELADHPNEVALA